MKPNSNPRAVAALCMQQLVKQRLALPLVLQDNCLQLDEKRKPLVQELCYGSCRYYWQLSGLIDQLLSKPLKAKDNDIYQLLIIGAYQLLYMRIPEHAALSETVNASKTFKKPWAKGMVNGVLRNLQRQKDTLMSALKPHQQAALPEWLFNALKQHYPNTLDDISNAFKTAAPLTLRVNKQHHSRHDYLALLEQHGIAAKAGTLSLDAVILEQAVDVFNIPSFEQGASSVQDEAAQLSAQLVLKDNPSYVLDACAAPGGKSCHLLEQAPDITLVSVDNDAKRLPRVQQNLDRIGATAELHCADITDTKSWWNGEPFDAILLDAPCSATGVIRRNPDIKLLRSQQDAAAMPALQAQIVTALWPCLKPGGRMIYATCSLLPEENDQLIANVINNLGDATIEKIDGDWGLTSEYGKQLLPSIAGNDGFYYACLVKAQ